MTETSLASLAVRVETAIDHFAKVVELNERLSEANLKALEAKVLANDRLYESRAAAQDLAVKAALAASEKASTKLEASQAERINELQGFRDAMKDQAAKFLTRKEAYAFLAAAIGLMTGVIALLV